MNPRIRPVVDCPHCGMDNRSSEERCRRCGKGLTLFIGPAANLPRRFRVGSMMLLVLATAPGLAALRVAPLVGSMLLMVMTPAAVRTTAVLAQRSEDHRPLSFDGKVAVFFRSIGLMMVVVFGTAVVFGLLTIPLSALLYSLGPYGMATAALTAGVIASGVGYLLLRKLWPYRD